MTPKKQGKPKARSWVRWMIVSEYGDDLCGMTCRTRHDALRAAHPTEDVIRVEIAEIPARKGRGKS
jgi:hypothetical protein